MLCFFIIAFWYLYFSNGENILQSYVFCDIMKSENFQGDGFMSKIKTYAKKYFIDAMSAMALGLFASLLIGTIFGTVGTYLGEEFVSNEIINKIGAAFVEMKNYAQSN